MSYDALTYNLMPIPKNLGIGFCTSHPIDKEDVIQYGLEYVQEGRYHNYYYTSKTLSNPYKLFTSPTKQHLLVDAFSPNLNKFLHVGHLRNLVLSKVYTNFSFSQISMLGTTLGFNVLAYEDFKSLLKTHGIKAQVILDVDLITNDSFRKCLNDTLDEGKEKYEGCKMWNNVVLIRSDGTPTYSYFDKLLEVAFTPHYYVTGNEQVTHFENLNLGHKHIPMGLILGPDGKKLKSRTGDAMLLSEFMETLEGVISGENNKEIAWNIAAMNILMANIRTNIYFDLEKWTNTSNPGMHVTYTYARLHKVFTSPEFTIPKAERDCEEYGYLWSLIDSTNLKLQRSKGTLDPSILAQHTFTLSQALSSLYHKEKIIDGKDSFVNVMYKGYDILGKSMTFLGLNKVESTL